MQHTRSTFWKVVLEKMHFDDGAVTVAAGSILAGVAARAGVFGLRVIFICIAIALVGTILTFVLSVTGNYRSERGPRWRHLVGKEGPTIEEGPSKGSDM